MALYAFDGTWNSAKDGDDPAYKNTNVSRFYDAYSRHSGTDDFYVAGVGTRFDTIGAVIGGVFGAGELPRLEEAYDHLCTVWDDGDRTIDVVGFSRGAAITLDFCHLVQKRGIRRPGTDTVVERMPTIRFLGVWDIVAAFGLANLGNTALNIGHHLTLPASNLEYCFHAMALDERRLSFLPTRLQGAHEVWFRGVHSDVGGGNGNRGLNDIGLKWMLCKAKGAGLPVPNEEISALDPDPSADPHFGSHKLPLQLRLIGAVDRYHYSVTPLQGATNPPTTCPVETMADEETAKRIGEAVVVFSDADITRVEVLWQTAQAAAVSQAEATRYDLTLEGVKGPLVSLIQSRISLVTDDAKLQQARANMVRLVNVAIHNAQLRGFHVMQEFFLNEALFNLPRLFPYTD